MPRHARLPGVLALAALAACGGVQQSGTPGPDEGPGPFLTAHYALASNGGIVSATASSSQPNSPPAEAIDGDFSTRWQAYGVGSWIAVDLGQVQPVSGVQIAWYRGALRQYFFSIALSSDGVNYADVYSGTSSGTTFQFELYTFPSTSARYVKVTVNGNTKNDWASIAEIAVTTTPITTTPPPSTAIAVAVSPQTASVTAGGTFQFTASVTGASDPSVTWSVLEGTAAGTVDSTGLYTAPATAGTYHVIAQSNADPTQTGRAAATVTAPTTTTSTSGSTGSTLPPGVVPAFPGAEGGGALSVGGRGGRVYEVTNLNDSGAGSLRACVEASGPRTCVFRVSGTINLLSSLSVTSPYLTVAGQTAPGGGIALYTGLGVANERAFSIYGGAHDITIRYLRCWGDWVSGDNPSTGGGSTGLNIWDNSYNFMADHVSLLWHSGKAIQWTNSTSSPSGKGTLQWSILGQEVSGDPSIGQSTPAGTGSDDKNFANNVDIDFHHNLFAEAENRFPMVGSTTRIINNALYNWGWFATAVVDVGNYDIIGNYYKPGPFEGGPDNGHYEVMLYPNSLWGGQSTLYFSNNKSDWLGPNGTRGVVTGNESDGGWSLLTGHGPREGATFDYAPLASSYMRSPYARLPSPGIDITPDPVSNLQSLLTAAGGVGASRQLDCYGNWVNTRDAADTKVITHFVNGTGLTNIPTSATNAFGGPLPTPASGAGCADSDHDGMPDAWELAHGLDPNDPTDGPVVQPDGYTNLEHYLNGQ